MKLRTIKVEDVDWQHWKDQAHEAGITLSAWIRDRCNGEVKLKLPSSVVIEKEVKLGPRCDHGVAKGYHCWQCGGLAVIK